MLADLSSNPLSPLQIAIWCTSWQFGFKPTVPLSNVSGQSQLKTRFSILKVFENRESSFEAQVSSFDFRGLRTNFRGLSFKFRDTRRIFRGSRTEISRKQFHSRKQNNRDKQNNWMYANIFSCCAFSTRHMRFPYLHWSWWQQTSLASKCVYNVSCQNEWLFFVRLQPGVSVLFSFKRLEPAAQNVNKC